MARTSKAHSDPLRLYHSGVLKAVGQQITPESFLATAFVQKLRARGIDASHRLDAIRESIAGSLEKGQVADGMRFEIETGDPEIDKTNLSLTLEESDFQQAAEHFERAIEDSIPDIIEAFHKSALAQWMRDVAEHVAYSEAAREAFNRRLAHRWKRPLDLLNAQIGLAAEVGENLNVSLRRHLRRSKRLILADVLLRLQARACQVAGEIHALLRSGFSDGALSRWRTLHELAVVSIFIEKHGAELAERYLLHSNIDSLKAAEQYDDLAVRLGEPRVAKRTLQRLRNTALRLERQFGKAFREEYGWACSVLKGTPNFARIESAVNLESFRPHFKLASNATHAGAKGTVFRGGNLTGYGDLLLAGPTNSGLDEAGRLTALSLSQVTACILLIRPTIDTVVWSKVLLTLARRIQGEFLKVQRRIEREERTNNSE